MLERPEFVDYWALHLGDLFQNRKERDHDVRGTKGVRTFHDWLRKQVAANRPWDELARDVLTATGTTTDNPAVGYYVVTVGEQRTAEQSEVAASVAQAFLGTRIGCAQCHNHPLEKYTQDDYYHFAAFFCRVKLDRKDPKPGRRRCTVGRTRTANQNEEAGRRDAAAHRPVPDAAAARPHRRPTVSPGDDPRLALAEWMTDPKNEYFTGAMVNRLWRHFLGVGLVEPVDDLRASNPPTNPELWKALEQGVRRRTSSTCKHLMRVILNSRTYQLSRRRPGRATRRTRASTRTTTPADCRPRCCSTPSARRPACRTRSRLPGRRPRRAGARPGAKSYFLSLFGRTERVTACACERKRRRDDAAAAAPASAASATGKINSGDGRLARQLRRQKDDGKVLDELFLWTLRRADRRGSGRR